MAKKDKTYYQTWQEAEAHRFKYETIYLNTNGYYIVTHSWQLVKLKKDTLDYFSYLFYRLPPIFYPHSERLSNFIRCPRCGFHLGKHIPECDRRKS